MQMYKELFTDNEISLDDIMKSVEKADKENMFQVEGIPQSKVFFLESDINHAIEGRSSVDVKNLISTYEFNKGDRVKDAIVVFKYCYSGIGIIFKTTIYIQD